MPNSTRDPLSEVLTGQEQRELTGTWQSPAGFAGWFTHVNHKSIGRRYIITAFVFFLLGGIEALVIRAQLSSAGSDLVSPQLFNTLFTMHGTTMMFLFAVPMVEGLGMYLVPLMIGTRDMAFPRLNAFGYYVYLIGGVALYVAFFLGAGPDAGWFNYVPLSGPEFSPGHRIDVWLALITFIEVAALTAAVELVVTILKQRAPGMTLTRIPLFVWSMLVMSVMIIFAMPAVIVASLLLALDRLVGTHFFTAAQGGDVLLWQHLFWFFGHPEVYIVFVPALGIVSAIVTVFCRRRIFGYRALVLSLVATGFISFGLWVHHMFTTGLPRMGENFFSAASMIIAIPTGVQIFCWIATIRLGRPRLGTPMLFILGFVSIFVLGGLTGVMVASVPFDAQVHDTYFVVAHFHYVLIGGVVFPILGGLYYWMPKFSGKKLSERLGKWVFGLTFIGFNVAFFPMHELGFDGMPRRIYTYDGGLGWEPLNQLATVGALILALGIALFVFDVLRQRPLANTPADPWAADSLEWLAESPPATFNFAAIPLVSDRHPLWSEGKSVQVTKGLLLDQREILVTTLVDANPHHTMRLPGPTYWPLIMAMAAAVGFIGAIFTPWAVVASVLLTFLSMVGWFWPSDEESELRWEGNR